MKKLLLVSTLALSLGACSTLSNIVGVVTGASVTANQAYIAANAYDALEQTATTYLTLPACVAGGTKVCRSAAAVNAIVPAIRSGRIARNNLEAAINANITAGTAVPATLDQLLTAATATLQGIIAEYGISSQ